MTPRLSIIVVSYNTRELTLECLRSVYAQTRETSFELLVVDNASTDESAAAIAAEFPQARLWPLDENLGFAAANNFAARHASGEWLLLLNPDTVVLDRAIDRLVGFAESANRSHPRAGIFGGRTLFPDGSLNPTSCWARPTLWSTFCIAVGLTSLFRRSSLFNPEAMPAWPRDSVREVDIVTGCFFLLRRSLWNRLGGFDPAFFMYGEEADLCLRVRREGVTGLICPDATIIHHGGASETVQADKVVKQFKAKLLLFARQNSKTSCTRVMVLLFAWTLVRLALFGSASIAIHRCRGPKSTWVRVWERRREWCAVA